MCLLAGYWERLLALLSCWRRFKRPALSGSVHKTLPLSRDTPSLGMPEHPFNTPWRRPATKSPCARAAQGTEFSLKARGRFRRLEGCDHRNLSEAEGGPVTLRCRREAATSSARTSET